MKLPAPVAMALYSVRLYLSQWREEEQLSERAMADMARLDGQLGNLLGPEPPPGRVLPYRPPRRVTRFSGDDGPKAG